MLERQIGVRVCPVLVVAGDRQVNINAMMGFSHQPLIPTSFRDAKGLTLRLVERMVAQGMNMSSGLNTPAT